MSICHIIGPVVKHQMKKSGETVNLSCPSNQKISINKIRFHGNCVPSKAESYISSLCDDKPTCTIAFDEAIRQGKCTSKAHRVTIKHKCVFDLKL